MNPDTPPAARRPPWFPIVTVGLAVGALVYFRAKPELEQNFKAWISCAIPLLLIVLNLLWFLITPRYSWRTRLTGLALVVALFFGLKHALRVDGTVNGTGLPRLAWKWSPPARRSLAPKAVRKGPAPVADAARLAEAADVPQFFGPHRDGIVTGANLARDWKAARPKELWRQPIGLGWSAFAVVKGHAYTQEQRGEEELVTCYDLFTGDLLWQHADKTCFTQWQSGTGPHATPTVDGGRVYAYGATGLLNCLDAATGGLIWQRSVLTENNLANLEWGVSASPLVVDDEIVVSGGNTAGPVLFAFQRDTGVLRWKAGDDKATYASPMAATLAGRRVLLSSNVRSLAAYDPAGGAVLFDIPWGGDKFPKASQPIVLGEDRVFISAGYGKGCHLYQIQADAEGKLSGTELWRSMRMKTQFNTPAVRDGRAYGLDDGGLACIDLATGNRLWKEGHFGAGQTLLVDDLILIQNENGAVQLAAARPEGYEDLGDLEALHSKTWNHPTLAGRFLLVRNDREAVCYELPTTSPAAPLSFLEPDKTSARPPGTPAVRIVAAARTVP